MPDSAWTATEASISLVPSSAVISSEAQADCTANHIAAEGGSFPSSTVIIAANGNATLVTATLTAQSASDTFLIACSVTASCQDPWNVALICDGNAVSGAFSGNRTAVANSAQSTLLGFLTGLSAGTHTVTVELFNQSTSYNASVFPGYGYLTILQIISTGGGFNFAPIGGSTKPKPTVAPA